jgi:hypothetical protein
MRPLTMSTIAITRIDTSGEEILVNASEHPRFGGRKRRLPSTDPLIR